VSGVPIIVVGVARPSTWTAVATRRRCTVHHATPQSLATSLIARFVAVIAAHAAALWWLSGAAMVMAGACPFLAECGLGSDGTFIGEDAWSGAGFCFHPWVRYQNGTITNPNCLLAWVAGRGKSMLANAMAIRSIATGRKVYVPGDPKGKWSVVARSVGGVAIELGGGSAKILPAGGATIPQLVVDGREVCHAMRRLVSGDLAGLFDGESTVTFDP
jgi:hypothetical protein